MTRLAEWIRLVCAVAVMSSTGAAAAADTSDTQSSTAEHVYDAARPKLLQIRTLLTSAGRQTSLGSGFLVSADGLALTNYHVVSQYALEPATYRLDYAAPDGGTGTLALLAVDVAHDLAVVRLDRTGLPFLSFDPQAVEGSLPKGERLYSMGNPLELGFTIVEGTYNGLVEHSYTERTHFSGAINPGMSGGPAVTEAGDIAGINVAKRLDGELVSFLVPPRLAAALLATARAQTAPPAPASFKPEIGRQLAEAQAGLYRALDQQGFRTADTGPYQVIEPVAPWFTCWANTNEGQVPKPRAAVETSRCSSDTSTFVANDLNTGVITLSHSHYRSLDLNEFQFANFLGQQNLYPGLAGWSRKWYTDQRCHTDFLSGTASRPVLRVMWCARAYREFTDLYDVAVVAVSQDRTGEALVARLSLGPVAFDTAEAVSRRFIEGIAWKK